VRRETAPHPNASRKTLRSLGHNALVPHRAQYLGSHLEVSLESTFRRLIHKELVRRVIEREEALRLEVMRSR
jgi:hypothetical protein